MITSLYLVMVALFTHVMHRQGYDYGYRNAREGRDRVYGRRWWLPFT